MSSNMDEKFKANIRDAVTDIMAAKEDAERVTAIETLLSDSQTTITNLTDVVTSKELEIAASVEEVNTLKAKVEELETKAEEFQTMISDAKEGSEKLEERASLAEGKLAEIAALQALAGRMSELEEAKVVATGDKRALQEDKVRTMSDEDFSAYLAERAEFRAELQLELKETASNSDKPELTAEEIATAEAAAAGALLNVETASNTSTNKYEGFGKQIALNMRSEK